MYYLIPRFGDKGTPCDIIERTVTVGSFKGYKCHYTYHVLRLDNGTVSVRDAIIKTETEYNEYKQQRLAEIAELARSLKMSMDEWGLTFDHEIFK